MNIASHAGSDSLEEDEKKFKNMLADLNQREQKFKQQFMPPSIPPPNTKNSLSKLSRLNSKMKIKRMQSHDSQIQHYHNLQNQWNHSNSIHQEKQQKEWSRFEEDLNKKMENIVSNIDQIGQLMQNGQIPHFGKKKSRINIAQKIQNDIDQRKFY